MDLTPGQKAARTKALRYGTDGLQEIAARALEARRANRALVLTALEAHLVRTARGATHRARVRGLACEDDLEGWALAMMDAQGHRCALSGVPFSLDVLGHGAAPRPYAPSIDRIDSGGGYTAGNIRVICWAANILLGTWGDEVAIRVARGIAARNERKDDR